MAFLQRLGRLGRILRRRPREEAPARETAVFPRFVQLGQLRAPDRLAYKPTPLNLRYFSRTPYARRAINAIKNPVAQLTWEVIPRRGAALSDELGRQIALATHCLEQPNEEDSFRSLLEQVLEDALCGGGAIEVQVGADPERPLWLWPVDGLSIQIYPGWSGGADQARYLQTLGYGGIGTADQGVALRDDELIYIRPNPTTSTPFGIGPLEVAFTSVARLLGVAEFAGHLSSNTRPSTILDLGEAASPDELQAFRAWWRNDIEGQGMMPIVGGMQKPQVLRLAPEGDEGLYLKYQEFLKAEIAAAFDLSPQNLGREAERQPLDRGSGRGPRLGPGHQAMGRPHRGASDARCAVEAPRLLPARVPLHRARPRGRARDRRDLRIYYRSNALTPNEQRARLGLAPLAGEIGDMTSTEAELALARAGVLPRPARARPVRAHQAKEDNHGS